MKTDKLQQQRREASMRYYYRNREDILKKMKEKREDSVPDRIRGRIANLQKKLDGMSDG